MLVQDTLTGYFHEVPDSQLYDVDFAEFPEAYGEAQMVYDGFGNPIGMVPPAAIIKGAQIARKIFSLFRRRRRGRPPAPQPIMMPPSPAMMPASAPAMVAPPPMMTPESMPPAEAPMGQVVYDGLGNPVGIVPIPRALAPMAARAIPAVARAIPGITRVPSRTPRPRGWIRPPLPYTGLGPKRLYMRCAVWPGPRGLVPAYAAQAQPPAAAQPAAAMAQMGRRRVRRRRR
jgi:hypothetical protein